MGSASFINQHHSGFLSYDTGTHVHLVLNDVPMGRFSVNNQYREGMPELVRSLHAAPYELYVLSGDNDAEKGKLQKIFGPSTSLQFGQSPQQKLNFIQQLQGQHKKVLMLGDGLNDAGALMQSQVGIAVSDNTAQFSPACDAILDGNQVHKLDKFIRYAKSGKTIVTVSFILSMYII